MDEGGGNGMRLGATGAETNIGCNLGGHGTGALAFEMWLGAGETILDAIAGGGMGKKALVIGM